MKKDIIKDVVIPHNLKIEDYDYIYLKRVPESLEGKVEKDKIYQVRDDGSLKLIYSI